MTEEPTVGRSELPERLILVVDDDAAVARIVERVLATGGLSAKSVGSADEARRAVEAGGIGLAIVDLTLPDGDGLVLTRWIKEHTDLGILILSARGDTTERIVGLEIGADDFLGKPFEPRELLARVRAVLRRTKPRPLPSSPASSAGDESVYEFDGLKLSVDRRTLHDRGGNPVELTNAEFGLLRALVEHPNRVLSRDQLLDLTHGERTSAFDRSVDVQVARLRKKIERASAEQQVIKTVRGAGYILAAKVRRGAPAPR